MGVGWIKEFSGRLVGERCAANERTVAFSVRWRTKNSNKNGFKRRRIEDGCEGPEDDSKFGKYILLS
ncbi:hypothetical protein T4B_4003 [Trichinella pseudospiralis]|uniref:Uncharacterized protein n=1 Tax=Trichinella pseudospiralis TaxID=6337 RepID=A0A0V1GS31_TRIPS|nr:hypothetical protein T4B_4003 [Trichinella pseudospiralis]